MVPFGCTDKPTENTVDWFIVREKHCFRWKNKPKNTDYKPDEQCHSHPYLTMHTYLVITCPVIFFTQWISILNWVLVFLPNTSVFLLFLRFGSRGFLPNYIISFSFHLHLILHTCVQSFKDFFFWFVDESGAQPPRFLHCQRMRIQGERRKGGSGGSHVI
jgi:hypothetical protein